MSQTPLQTAHPPARQIALNAAILVLMGVGYGGAFILSGFIVALLTIMGTR